MLRIFLINLWSTIVMRWAVKSTPYSLSHHYFLLCFFFTFIFIFRKLKSKTFLIKLYLILIKLDNHTPAILEVRHPLYSLILQGFVLLRVIYLLLIYLVTKDRNQYTLSKSNEILFLWKLYLCDVNPKSIFNNFSGLPSKWMPRKS